MTNNNQTMVRLPKLLPVSKFGFTHVNGLKNRLKQQGRKIQVPYGSITSIIIPQEQRLLFANLWRRYHPVEAASGTMRSMSNEKHYMHNFLSRELIAAHRRPVVLLISAY